MTSAIKYKTMQRIIFSLFIVMTLGTQLIAPQLYMPRNIKNAYEQKTRFFNGMPGSRY
jgi:Gpi18-like mannosyltransferase